VAGVTLLILETHRNKIYGIIINMKINSNIGLLMIVSLLNLGVGEYILLGGNEERHLAL
jgi:hypothetical protein